MSSSGVTRLGAHSNSASSRSNDRPLIASVSLPSQHEASAASRRSDQRTDRERVARAAPLLPGPGMCGELFMASFGDAAHPELFTRASARLTPDHHAFHAADEHGAPLSAPTTRRSPCARSRFSSCWFRAALGVAVAEQTEYATVVAERADLRSKTINYADLNLQHHEGVVALYRRIRNAADFVCYERPTGAQFALS